MESNTTIHKFKEVGLRVTAIRKGIIDILHQARNPLSVSDILAQLKANKTTIYRDMEILTRHDFLVPIDLGDGIKRYELTTKGHHHHLVCLKCRSVTELDLADDFTRKEALIASREKFMVLRHTLDFFGLCKSCNI